MTMHVLCVLLAFTHVLNTDRVFAQTTLPSETDPLSTSAMTTCETGTSPCGTEANDVTNVGSVTTVGSDTTIGSVTTVGSVSTTRKSTATTTPVNGRSTSSPTRKPDAVNSSSELSTVKPPAVHKQSKERPLLTDGTCSCDLMVLSCDINCCCDPDCTAFDRQSFSQCQMTKYPPYENRYCYATKLVYLNNTEHVIQQAENGMFCIVRSNLAGSVIYPHHTAAFSYQDFTRRWKLSHSSTWPIMHPSETLNVDSAESYIEGSPLWTLLNQQIHSFSLPGAGLTSVCTDMKTIKFLRPWSSKCIQKPPQTLAQCESRGLYFYEQVFNIVKSPALINLTDVAFNSSNNCSMDVCVLVNAFVCSNVSPSHKIFSNCIETSQSALFNMSFVEAEVCHGVVKDLKYIFVHNGTEGLKHISVYYVLTNVSMAWNSSPTYYDFSVEFNWDQGDMKRNVSGNVTHINNSTYNSNVTPLARSGNPGYIVGKPIPSGYRVKSRVAMNNSKDAKPESSEISRKDSSIELSHDSHQWLTLPGSNTNGFCDLGRSGRTLVTFGEDLHVSCSVEITSNNISSEIECQRLRDTMLHILLGDAASASNATQLSDWGRVVAAFGNANTSNPQEWVPLLLDIPASVLHPSSQTSDSGSSCEDVPLGIHIHVMYAFVGAISNPQAKIVGVLLRVDPVRDVTWFCGPPVCIQKDHARHLHIASSVVFVDVSSPSVTRFAEPPAIHIRLPPDFFYPFLSSGVDAPKTSIAFHGFVFPLIMFADLYLITVH